MKLLDWISRKPKQEEASTTNAADLLSHQQQQQQQVLKRSVHAVQSKLLKLNQNKAALQGGNKSDRDPAADTKKRREIVKIFVNHEEYGLLAIGTLGLYDVSGVEPEIELFEVKPNLLFQPDDDNKDQNEKKQHKNEEEEQQRRKKDEGSLVLRKPEKKKVFSLDPSSLIGTKLLKRSNKLLDRILHPLNHFSFSSISASTREREEDHLQDKQSSKSLSLFKKLVLSGNSAKQITGSTGNSSENSGSAIETRARSHHHRNHRSNSGSSSSSITNTLKRRSTAAFSCMSVQVEDDESEPESESEAEADNGSLRGDTTWTCSSSSSLSSRSSSLSSSSSSLSSSTSTATTTSSSSSVVTSHSSSSSECPAACSAPGDPKPGHQQADAKDIKPEYWIRTDSDYVVLEL